MKTTTFGATDIGRKRKVNEDNFKICEELDLYLVADGMGGHIAGDIASKLAVSIVAESVQHEIKRCEEDDSYYMHPGQILEKSIHLANHKILETTKLRTDLEGMGTTIVAAMIRKNTLHIASVGDSRIYRVRDGEGFLLTTDHSWVNMQIRLGNMTVEESRYHPMRNVITRALGTQKHVEVDVMAHLIRPGDTIMLCSDGLTNLVMDPELVFIISENKEDIEKGASQMIDLANERGGDDNITVLLLHFEGVLDRDSMDSDTAIRSLEKEEDEQETEVIAKDAIRKRLQSHRFPKHPP